MNIKKRFLWISRALALTTLISVAVILRYGVETFYVWAIGSTASLGVGYVLYQLFIKPISKPRGGGDFWSVEHIRLLIPKLDWYQFELFAEALLSRDGYTVERRGGAEADGGVDLVATSEGEITIVQCKHWQNIKVQEKVVRELLGSMTYFKGHRGALFTIIGATDPAYAFAEKTNIEIFDTNSLAMRAKSALNTRELQEFLLPPHHHCPKCESVMVLRTTPQETFLGCSNFPRCRGVIKVSG